MTEHQQDTTEQPNPGLLAAAVEKLHQAEAAIEHLVHPGAQAEAPAVDAPVAAGSPPTGNDLAGAPDTEPPTPHVEAPMVVMPRAALEQLLALAEETERNIPGHTGRSIELVGHEMRTLILSELSVG